MAASHPFRDSASFGKRIEYWVIGRMLKEGMDVYVPLVDDHAVDAIVKRRNGTIAQIQIKARSSTVKQGNAALFAAIRHDKVRHDYWFVFYSERLDATWIMSSEEFDQAAYINRRGTHIDLRTISFAGTRRNRVTGQREEFCRQKWDHFRAKSFQRIANGD